MAHFGGGHLPLLHSMVAVGLSFFVQLCSLSSLPCELTQVTRLLFCPVPQIALHYFKRQI